MESENSTLINDLKIQIDNLNESGFPNEFVVTFNELDEYFNIHFLKVENNRRTKNSDDVFTIDNVSGKPVKYEFNSENIEVNSRNKTIDNSIIRSCFNFLRSMSITIKR